ncbi:RNA polymerase sigma factor [Bacillus salitolerans]|uniref:RNA polymerase sigma factor n=1 Tax=Bacillus salitolerans TaxID=1437434 RepID=A0ABW4LZP4_9BACI
MIKNDVSNISEELERIHDSFDQMVQPFRSALWNYCKRLTGSPWDAEDLLQETLLKAFASLTRVKQSVNPKSYLFRIASNTWIDDCRRNKIQIEELEIEQAYEEHSVSYIDLSEAMDTLIHQLPPKQASVILLMEVHNFTAKETADILGTTEGAVYSLLNRARNRLQKLHTIDQTEQSLSTSAEKEAVIQQYMDSFVKGDFKTIGTLLADYATNEVVGRGLDIGKVQIRKNSMGDWASGGSDQSLQAKLVTLWGKQSVMYTKETKTGTALWDITTVEIENGRIAKHRSYYFCKEFLEAAAKELHIPLFVDKELYGVQW